MIARRGGEGIGRKFGMDMYIPLQFKWITNKDLLHSTWNSAQCYVEAWIGESLGENGYMYMYDWVASLFTWNYHDVVNHLYSNTK